MASDYKSHKYKYSEGTTQKQRYLESLDPNAIELMGFTVEDWMEFAYKFSKKVSFFKDNPKTTDLTWESFFKSANEIKSLAASYSEGDIEPHLGLFICFLKLLEHSKERFNKLSKRHLDFYYHDVLQLQKQVFTSDKVYALFELAKTANQQLITKDSLLDAGKDSEGNKRTYSINEELVINKIAIDDLKATYSDSGGWYAAPIPKSGDGQGGEFSKESKSWLPFGDTTYKRAGFGFTLAAPSLKMSEGPRHIELTLALGANPNSFTKAEQLAESLRFSLTGKSDWIAISLTKNQIKLKEEVIVFQLHLDETEDPIVSYDSSVHQGNYKTNHPLLKIEFNTSEVSAESSFNLYKKLAGKSIKDISLKTTSLYSESLIVKNDNGIINTENAFFPFGPQARKKSKLKIKSEEWVGKHVTQAILKLDWKDLPEDFASYYSAYTLATVNNGNYVQNSSKLIKKLMGEDRFKVKLSIIRDNRKTKEDLKTTLQIDESYNEYWSNQKNALEDAREFDDQDEVENEPSIEDNKNLEGNALFKTSNKSEFKFFASKAYVPLNSDDYLLHLELEEDFLHDVYGKVINAHAIAEKAAPNSPYTPVAESISVMLTTEEHFNTDDRHIQLFHDYPYGHIKQANDLNTTLVQDFNPKGELCIGLKNCHVGENVQLLCQLEEGTENPDAITKEGNSEIEWHYLHQNQWVEFNKEQLLKDETNNFLSTGLVKIQIPKAFDTQNTLLPEGLFWIRASQTTKTSGHNLPDTVCRFIDIHTQALEAEFVDNSNTLEHLEEGIPQDSISKLVNRISSVKKVNQPYASFGGAPEESDHNFYRRISERLRHKNRAITQWDYEHLVLQKFKYLYKVKCLNHSTYSDNNSPGNVLIVVVPNIKNQNVFDLYKPRVSANKLSEIEDYINTLNSDLVTSKVISPDYETVSVSLDVKFHTGYDSNHYTTILKKDIAKFLSPWAFDMGASISFNNTLYASEFIFYIEQLGYVDYIKNFSLNHQGKVKQEVIPTNEKCILTSVPASEHVVNSITASICKV